MSTRSRSRWKVVLGVFAVLIVLAMVPALIPPGGQYDPAPYFAAVKQSAALPATKGTTPLRGDLVIRRARIVDVNGVRGPTSIRIEAGRITAIADDVGKGTAELDVAGATVMPGLVDAHAHLSFNPGGLARHDDAATTRKLRLHHMRAYLASGITTIFDPSVENSVMEDIQRALAAGHAGPRYLAVGTPLASPGGYFHSVFPSGIIHRPDDVGPHLDGIVKAGAVGVKIAFEPGFVAPVWPLHRPEVERAVVEETRKRKLPVYAHAERTDMVRRALAIGPHALVHGPIDATPALAAEIAAANIPVVTTLALFGAQELTLHPEELDEPHMRRVVPALLLQSARDPAQYRAGAFGLVSEVTPFVKGRYRDLFARIGSSESGRRQAIESNRKMLVSAMESIRHLKAAGVPLVVGSDSGNWPLFFVYFHGPTTWRELRLLADAGLSPQEVLRAGTVNAFKMLGLEDRLGTVDVGKLGDLVVVKEDPLVDVAKAMRSLRYTIREGVARTPDEWMKSDE